MGLFATAWALGEATFNRVVIQNANKVLSDTGADRLITRWFKRKPDPAPALTVTLYAFGFLSPFPPTSDITNLRLALKANETVSVERVTILFNRPGGNGSYELAIYAPPRTLHQGEEVNITVMHYRMGFDAFWGDEDNSTRPLVQIDNSLWGEHTRRHLHFEGPFYCEIVAMHDKGEARKHFTILNTSAPGKPSVLDPSDHQNYDPNRFIPSRGLFLH